MSGSLIAFVVTLLLLCLGPQNWQTSKADVSVIITNISAGKIEDSWEHVVLYENAYNSLNFSTAKAIYDNNSISQVRMDGQDVWIRIRSVSPKETTIITFENLTIGKRIGFCSTPKDLGFVYCSIKNCSVVTLAEYDCKTTFGERSFASTYCESSNFKLADGTEENTWVQYFKVFVYPTLYVAFFVSLFLVIFGVVLYIQKLSSLVRYPFFTLGTICISLFTYTFLGTGYELQLLPTNSISPVLFLPISVFAHASYDHIVGNLVYFTIVSFLFESWVKVRSNLREFILFYVLFFCLSYVPGLLTTILKNGSGFGLSFTVEALSASLSGYIISNRERLLHSKKDVLATLMAGLTISGFWNWLIVFTLLNSVSTTYDVGMAAGHIFFGACSFLMALFIYELLDDIMQWFLSLKDV